VVSYRHAFPSKSYMHSSSPNACYMPCPSHPSWLQCSNYTWRRVQVMMLPLMQFSPASCHFIPLWSKYSPQHHVLKHPQSMFLPSSHRPSFTSTQNHRQNYSFVHSNFYIFWQQTRRQKVLDRMVASIARIQFLYLIQWRNSKVWNHYWDDYIIVPC
jgi:hypothetical protein